MQNTPVLLMMVCTLCVIFYMGYSLVEDKKESQKIKKRIESIGGFAGGTTTINSKSVIRVTKESLLEKKLNAILSANKTGENLLQLKLYRCGIKLELKKIGLYLAILWFAFFSILNIITHLGFMYSTLAAAGAMVSVVYFALSFLEKRRRKKTLVQLSTAVEIILRGIKSGSSVEKTFQIVARELGSPLEEEFNQITRELEFGVSFEKVMHRVAARINIPEFYFFTTALVIQRKSGGSLVDVLENIITTLNKIQEIRLKIKIYSSEAKTSGYVLACLPAVIWVVLMQIKPEHIEFFYTDPLGEKILYIAIGLFIGAFVMIKRLINLDV